MRLIVLLGMSLLLASSPAVAQRHKQPQRGTPILLPDLNTVEGMRTNAFVERLLPPDLKKKEVRKSMHIFMAGKRPTPKELVVVRAMVAYCHKAGTLDFSPCIAARRVLAKG
jgi:hypothetical protein